MLEVRDAACGWVNEKVLRTTRDKLKAVVGESRGTYKVRAMPPVARIPQRTVLGDDMVDFKYGSVF
jgi:hypothetical protein